MEQAEQLLKEGNQQFENGQYQAAITTLEKAKQLFEEQSDWKKVLSVESTIIENLTHLGSFEQAIQRTQQATEDAKLHLDPHDLLHAYLANNFGSIYASQNRLEKAVIYFQHNVHFLEKNYPKQWDSIASSLNNVGYCYISKGDFNKGIYFYKKALNFRLTNLPEEYSSLAVGYNNVGCGYMEKGVYLKAMDCFKKVLEIRQKILPKNHPDLALSYSNIGTCFSKMSDHGNAILYQQKSLTIQCHNFGDTHLSVALSYNNLGACYSQKENHEQALVCHQKALHIRNTTLGENTTFSAISYAHVGSCFFKLGNIAAAIQHLKKAVTIYENTSSTISTYIGVPLNNLGRCYQAQGKFNLAIEYLQKAQDLRDQYLGKTHPDSALSSFSLAKCYADLNNYPKALEELQGTLIRLCKDFENKNIHTHPNLENYSSAEYLLDTLLLKGTTLLAYKAQENKDEVYLETALQTFLLAVKLNEQMRQSYKAEASKLFLAEKMEIAYTKGLALTFELYQLTQKNIFFKKAFFLFEKAKSAILLAALNESKAKIESKIPEHLQQQLQDYKAELNYLENSILKEELKPDEANEKGVQKNKVLLQQWQSEFFEHHQGYHQLIEQVEQKYPEYFALKYDNTTVDIETLQAALDPTTLLIQYFVGEHTIFIMAVEQTHIHFRQIPKPADFEKLLKKFQARINQLNKKQYIQTATQLYDLLLASVVTTACTHLVIIPHSVLHTLPFEALLCSQPTNRQTAYTDLDYVLSRYTVTYHYSATLWYKNIGQKIPKIAIPDSFVGFAPVFADPPTPVKALPANGKDDTLAAALSTRGVRIGGMAYNELLHSKTEVFNIAQAFKEKGLDYEVAFHEEATKATFLKKISTKKYIHIASHGIYNKKQPELSGILFSQKKGEGEENSVLYIGDAYHLKIDADLLVLSSCESGIGKMAKGEGMIAINRGFLYAGAKNIIFTLFKVYDAQSSQLMQLLYHNILKKMPYAVALRQAKLDLIQQHDLAPKAWAGFVLIGTNET